jgi:hypothetical protein
LGRRRQQGKKEQQRVPRHVSHGRDPASSNELTSCLLARMTLWERKGKLNDELDCREERPWPHII